MITARFACGCLFAGLAAAAMGCGSAPERSTAGRPAAALVARPLSEKLSPLLAAPLPNVKGKTFTSAIVAFPPTARAVPHRHGDAFVYAYVLEGSVVSQLEGEPVRTYHRGENWIERPGAHHVLTKNPSRTEPAKLLVVFVSDTGAKLKVDDPPRHSSTVGD